MAGFFQRLMGREVEPDEPVDVAEPAPRLALEAAPKASTPEPTPEPAPAPKPPPPPVNVIGHDMTIRGSLSSTSGLELTGAIEGDVEVDELTIGGSGKIVGAVQGSEVVVEGSIQGDVGASKLVISATGSIDGDVTATAVVIDEGGILEGRCHMGSPRSTAVEPEPAAKAQATAPKPSFAPKKPTESEFRKPTTPRPKPAVAPA